MHLRSVYLNGATYDGYVVYDKNSLIFFEDQEISDNISLSQIKEIASSNPSEAGIIVNIKFNSRGGIEQEIDALKRLAEKYKVTISTRRTPVIPRGKGDITEVVLGLPVGSTYKKNSLHLSLIKAEVVQERYRCNPMGPPRP